jgi:uncharacterized protein involved in oxidation of intracellular sulfur
MKKTLIILTILLGALTIRSNAQSDSSNVVPYPSHATIGVILCSNDIETIWNAFRFAAFSRAEGDTVIVYLLGKGVELEALAKTNKDLKLQVNTFIQNGGFVLGSGLCLRNRKYGEPYICRLSSMEDMYNLIKNSKKTLTF